MQPMIESCYFCITLMRCTKLLAICIAKKISLPIFIFIFRISYSNIKYNLRVQILGIFIPILIMQGNNFDSSSTRFLALISDW